MDALIAISQKVLALLPPQRFAFIELALSVIPKIESAESLGLCFEAEDILGNECGKYFQGYLEFLDIPE